MDKKPKLKHTIAFFVFYIVGIWVSGFAAMWLSQEYLFKWIPAARSCNDFNWRGGASMLLLMAMVITFQNLFFYLMAWNIEDKFVSLKKAY